MIWKTHAVAIVACFTLAARQIDGAPQVRFRGSIETKQTTTTSNTHRSVVQTESTKVNAKVKSDDFEWLECQELIGHLGTINERVGVKHPRKVGGYSRNTCNTVLNALKKHNPDKINLIVNLSGHIRAGRKFNTDALSKMEDFAGKRRLADQPGCNDHPTYEMGNVGPGATTRNHTIGTCPDNSCPTLDTPSSQPETCIPDMTTNNSFNFMNLVPDYSDDKVFDKFEEFTPGYGGGVGYTVYTLSLDDPSLTVEASNESPFDGALWTGCDQDRVGDYDGLARFLEVLLIEKGITLTNEIICELIDDDFEIVVGVVAFDFVFAPKVACVAVLTILKLAQLGLETIWDQIDFQNGLVDGAEIQAGYFHTTNLLDKQCGVFYEAVCRCSEASKIGSYGTGCDGLDSNCNGDPDDCEEDTVPPDIDVANSIVACSRGQWFADKFEAIACIEGSVVASDDCNSVKPLSISRVENGTCADSSIKIIAEDGCERTTEVIVPVQIDNGDPPTVTCSVHDGNESTSPGNELNLIETGPGLLENVNLKFSAQDGTAIDSCGISSLKVDVFANEIENFNAQAMAQFFQADGEDGKLYVAAEICSTTSNGQCIKDPDLELRVYTIVVTAIDLFGLESSAECFVNILPRGGGIFDSSAASQRFLLTSFSPSC